MPMSSSSPVLDISRPLRVVAEITRACRRLRNAYLDGRREELLSIYQGYKDGQGKVPTPDGDALLVGFREDWRREDYQAIAAVGERIPVLFFEDNREAGALYQLSRRRAGL
jgi:hypothetical protein